MRSLIFFMTICASPVLAHASEPCAPHDAISELSVQKGNFLRGPLDVEELEKAHSIVIRETGKALPFGYVNKAWLAMKAAIQPGDQIYFLSHSEGTFYVEYHVLVRDGCTIRRLQGKIT